MTGLTDDQVETLLSAVLVADEHYAWVFLSHLESAFPDTPWERLYWEHELARYEHAVEANRERNNVKGMAYFGLEAAKVRARLHDLGEKVATA